MKTYAHWPLILAYHSVHPKRQDMLSVHPDEFTYQIESLFRQGYRSMTLADYCCHPANYGERIVILTFDDGYEDNYHYAWPVLRQFGYVGTVFLVSGFVGTDRIFEWDRSYVVTPTQYEWYRVLNWDQIEDMASSGMEFGSHTVTHSNLTELTSAECRYEIEESRAVLSARLGNISSFCYPRGDLNNTVLQMVQEAGYCCAVVTPPHRGLPLNRFALRRTGIYHVTTRQQFHIKRSIWFRRFDERFHYMLKALRRGSNHEQ